MNATDLNQHSVIFREVVDPNAHQVLTRLLDYGLRGVFTDEEGISLPPCRGRQYLPGAHEEAELGVS